MILTKLDQHVSEIMTTAGKKFKNVFMVSRYRDTLVTTENSIAVVGCAAK